MDARSEDEGSREAAAAAAPVFKKLRREYIGAAPHPVRPWEGEYIGISASSKTIIQSIYKMPNSSGIKTRCERCQAAWALLSGSNANGDVPPQASLVPACRFAYRTIDLLMT
jgi:hypothetical protein